MNLDTLNVKIQADNSDIKKKLGELKAQLEQTEVQLKEFKQQLSDWDSIGIDKTSLAYQDLQEKIAAAEQEQKQLNAELEEYTKVADDAAAATDGSGGGLGAALGKVAVRMFGLMKIIQEVKKAIEDFMASNPDSPITKSIEEAKQSWNDLKEDLIQEAGPLIETIAEGVVTINESLKPVNETVGYIIKMLKESGILELLKDAIWLAGQVATGPLKLLNMGLEETYGKTVKISHQMKDINVEFKDLTKYQEKLNKGIKQTKQLVSGFDELNIFANKEDVDNQEDTNELKEYYVELLGKQAEIEGEIGAIWREYASALGLTVEQYQKLWEAYKNGDEEEFGKLVAQFGINWNTAKDNLDRFATDGFPKIENLKKKLAEVTEELQKIAGLYAELAGVELDKDAARREASIKTLGFDAGNPKEVMNWIWNTFGRSGGAVQGVSEKPTQNTFSGWQSGLDLDQYGYGNYYKPYADGGVFTSPTLGLVGEYAGATHNPEIITPQDIMYDTMIQAQSGLVDVVAQAAAQVVQAINNQNLEVSIGDDVIASSAARGNKAYFNMTGGYLI